MYRRASTLRWGYNITPEDYNALVKAQDSKCAICGKQEERLVIDHDHSCCPYRTRGCGKCIRGLLCDHCNKRLGMFEKDSQFFLMAAPDYLKRREPKKEAA